MKGIWICVFAPPSSALLPLPPTRGEVVKGEGELIIFEALRRSFVSAFVLDFLIFLSSSGIL